MKKYVDDLDGEINVESANNQGTTFFIDIPFEKVLVDTVYGKTSSVSNLDQHLKIDKKVDESKTSIGAKPVSILSKKEGPNVLLIEDNLLAARMAKTLLETTNCNVTLAVDVQSSLESLSSVKFDLVVSDIGLPDGTGIDVINAIKEDKSALNYPTPFVAITANADKETLQKSKEAGFLSVNEKPITRDLVETILKEFVARGELIKATVADTLLEQTQCLNDWLQQKNSRSTPPSKASSIGGLGRDLPETEEQLFELEQYPLLDVIEALELFSMSEDELANLLSIMVGIEEGGIPNDKTKIQQAYGAGDWDTVEKLAYKTKGGAGYVGTVRMKYACMYLERYRKARGHSDSLEKLYKQLMDVLEATELQIKDWLKKKMSTNCI